MYTPNQNDEAPDAGSSAPHTDARGSGSATGWRAWWSASLVRGWPLGGGLLVTGFLLCGVVINHRNASSLLHREVRENLVRLACAAAVLVDGDGHRQFFDRSQERSPEYEHAVAPLRRFLQEVRSSPGGASNDFKFIYTCILTNDQVRFILDPTPEGDADHDGVDDKAHVMQAYTNASPALIQVLNTGKAAAEEEPYTDEWGTFLSAFAPFLDSRGHKVGVVGLDLNAADYAHQMAGLRRRAWIEALVAVILGAGVTLSLGSVFRRVEGLVLMEEDARERLRRHQERFLTLVHNLPTPACHVRGRDVVPNVAFMELTGHPGERLAELNSVMSLLFREREIAVFLGRTLGREGVAKPVPARLLTASGGERSVELIVHVYEEGEVWFLRDVTEEERARLELLRLKDEAEAANRAKGAFLATMSHEIRTPMNGVIGMTSLLADTPLEEEQLRMVQTIQACSDSLLVVINDILDFSKLEAGSVEIEVLPFQLRSCFQSCLDLFAPRAREKGLGFSLEIAPECPEVVEGDETRLRQVLSNLLNNAIKFTESGGGQDPRLRRAFRNCRRRSSHVPAEGGGGGFWDWDSGGCDGPSLQGFFPGGCFNHPTPRG